MEQVEPSVALLLLWEAVDLLCGGISRPWPMPAFIDVHDKDGRCRAQVLTASRMRMQLSAGIPCRSAFRWSTRMDPAVGDPFIGDRKAHIQNLFHQHPAVASSADLGPPQKPLKQAVQLHPR